MLNRDTGEPPPWQVALYLPFLRSLPISGVSISVVGDSRQESTICASDQIAVRLDELQFSLGEGPHWTALRTAEPVIVKDVNGDALGRWPMFQHAAKELGVGALFSFPLTMGAAVVGVVDMYRDRPGSLDGAQIAAARDLAAVTGEPAVRSAMLSAGDEAPTGSPAPEMRREVQQATGMVLVQLDVDATEAFFRIKTHAFITGRSILDVARDVVEHGLDFRMLSE